MGQSGAAVHLLPGRLPTVRPSDDADPHLADFGYRPLLVRSIGRFSSFAAGV